MLVFDTETTGLLKPEIADLAAQPKIIEIGMVKLDHKYKELGRFDMLLYPGEPIDEEVHKRITGLTNADLEGKPTFLEILPQLAEFMLGERRIVCHNSPFDMGMLRVELERCGAQYAFPWPPEQLCTVQLTKHIKGHRLKLTDLYELKIGKPLKQEHRAMADVKALVAIIKKMKL